MVKAFSFAVYGTNPKYCQGMVENLNLITQHYPDYEVHLTLGNDVPTMYSWIYRTYSQVRIHPMTKTGGSLMSERFLIADNPRFDVCFIRDADSRITERDRWCISEFLASSALFHIIRDHPDHIRPIMGGMWGIKRGALKESLRKLYVQWVDQRKTHLEDYQSDQDFLQMSVYPLVKDKAIVHSNYIQYPGEKVFAITYPRSKTNFVGNVVEFCPDGSSYFIHESL